MTQFWYSPWTLMGSQDGTRSKYNMWTSNYMSINYNGFSVRRCGFNHTFKDLNHILLFSQVVKRAANMGYPIVSVNKTKVFTVGRPNFDHEFITVSNGFTSEKFSKDHALDFSRDLKDFYSRALTQSIIEG